MSRSDRPNTEIQKLNQSLKDLDQQIEIELSQSPISHHSVYFLAEALAWCVIKLAQAQIFSKRLGSPGSDADVFGVLQRAGVLDLVQARKLKQFCELRHLSSREVYQIDSDGVMETLRNRREPLGFVGSFFEA